MCFPDRTFVHGIYGQKLISYGHLEGEAGLERGKNGERVTKIVNLVCASADTTATDRYQPDVCLDGLLCQAIFPFYAAIGTQFGPVFCSLLARTSECSALKTQTGFRSLRYSVHNSIVSSFSIFSGA